MPGNGMVERCGCRASSEILGTAIWSHQQLERLLRGFNAAHRYRVLDGKTPNRAVVKCFKARRKLADAGPHDRATPADVVSTPATRQLRTYNKR